MPDIIFSNLDKIKRKMTLKNTDNKFIRYFKRPLFGVSALTAYNLPNSLIHIPVIVMLVYSGVYICSTELKPLLVVYFVVALYMARDMIIISYKNSGVPVVIWAIFVPFIYFKKEVAEHLALSQQDSITATLVLVALFVVYVFIFVKCVFK